MMARSPPSRSNCGARRVTESPPFRSGHSGRFHFRSRSLRPEALAARSRHPDQRNSRRGRRRFHHESGRRRARGRFARTPAQIARTDARPDRQFRQRQLLHARGWLSRLYRHGSQLAAELGGIDPSQILVCSTGVIGAPLRVEKILAAVPHLVLPRSAEADAFEEFAARNHDHGHAPEMGRRKMPHRRKKSAPARLRQRLGNDPAEHGDHARLHRHGRRDFARASRPRPARRRSHLLSIRSPSMATPRRTTPSPACQRPVRRAQNRQRRRRRLQDFLRRARTHLHVARARDRRRRRRRAARDRNRSARRSFRSRRRPRRAHDRQFAARENRLRRRRSELGPHPRRCRTLRRQIRPIARQYLDRRVSPFAAAAASIPSTSAPRIRKCSRSTSRFASICTPAKAPRASGPATSPSSTSTLTPAIAPKRSGSVRISRTCPLKGERHFHAARHPSH